MTIDRPSYNTALQNIKIDTKMEHSDYTWLLELITLNLLIEDAKLHKKEHIP